MSDRERLQALKEQALQMKDELSKAQEVVEIDDDDDVPSKPGTGASTTSNGRAAAAAAALPPPATTRRRAAAAATAAAASPFTTTATTNEEKENNNSTNPQPPPPEEDEEHDKVLLLLQMDHQKDIKIKVNKTHLFEKVFEAYAKAKKLNRQNLVFTFNDDDLNDLDQPRYIIGMETLGQQAHTHTDTDPKANIIKVTDKAALEAARAAARAAAVAAEEQATKTVEIVLQWGGGGSKTVRMKAGDPFKKMMDRVCEWKGKERSEVRFSFDGEALKEGDTPEKLDMEDGDKVDVYGLE